MTREMLFLCDVLEAWCKKNHFPHRCASDLLHNADTKGRLTGNGRYDTYDNINRQGILF